MAVLRLVTEPPDAPLNLLDNPPAPKDDRATLGAALVAVRRAASCASISAGARRSLGTTCELLECLIPPNPKGRS
jgi:hypothetical protein